MIIEILSAIVGVWTMLGLFVMMELNTSNVNWKTFVVLGPVLGMVVGMMCISELLVRWVEKK